MGALALPSGAQVPYEGVWRYPSLGWTHWAPGLELTNRSDIEIQEIWLREPLVSDPLGADLRFYDGWEDARAEFRKAALPGEFTWTRTIGFTLLGFLPDSEVVSLADAVIDTPVERLFSREELVRLVSLSEAEELAERAALALEEIQLVTKFHLWCIAAVCRPVIYAEDGGIAGEVASLISRAEADGLEFGAVTATSTGIGFALCDPKGLVLADVETAGSTLGMLVWYSGRVWRFRWHTEPRALQYEYAFQVVSSLPDGRYTLRNWPLRIAIPAVGTGRRHPACPMSDSIRFLLAE